MKWIKKFESFIIDLSQTNIDLMESLSIWHDDVLSTMNAEEVDIFKTINLPIEFKNKLDISSLSDDIEFINSLSSIGLKKSQIENTDDYQTFLNKPCRFMMIYDVNSNELENPEYILFQVWNETLNKWSEASLFKINGDVKKFYDKLSSKTIEIIDGDKNYIYATSNGNDWDLQNIEMNCDAFPKTIRKEDLQKVSKERNLKINII